MAGGGRVAAAVAVAWILHAVLYFVLMPKPLQFHVDGNLLDDTFVLALPGVVAAGMACVAAWVIVRRAVVPRGTALAGALVLGILCGGLLALFLESMRCFMWCLALHPAAPVAAGLLVGGAMAAGFYVACSTRTRAGEEQGVAAGPKT